MGAKIWRPACSASACTCAKIHAAVAMLTGFYVTAAIAPWTLILFF